MSTFGSKKFWDLSHKGKDSIPYYILVVFLVFVFYFIGQLPLVLVQYLQMGKHPEIGLEELTLFEQTMDFGILRISKNLGLVLLISMFIFAMVGLWLGLRLQGKKIIDLITPTSVDWRRILYGFAIWMVLFILVEIVMYFKHPHDYELRYAGWSFWGLVLICITLLPIQTTLEELVFRGHIMQGVYARTHNLWVPLVISSILFSLIHSFNPEVQKYGFWVMQLYYLGAGIFLGLITIMDGRLELALGIHAATNIFGAMFFVYDGAVLQTNALFYVSSINPLLVNIAFIGSAVTAYMLLSKKYQWPPIASLWTPRVDETMDVVSDNQKNTQTIITPNGNDNIISQTDYNDLFTQNKEEN